MSLRSYHSTPDESASDPVLGREVRLGKLAVKKDARNLKFASYVPRGAKLPEPPTHIDRSGQIPAWPMYANDRLGDCTCASVGHQVILHSKYGGRPRTPAEQDVLNLYYGTGTDDGGRYMLDVLNYWRQNGVGGMPGINAFVQVNPKNHQHVKLAMYLFGSLYAGFALPLSAQSQERWTVGRGRAAQPGSWGGHAVALFDYDAKGVRCVTWSRPLEMTWGFFDRYCDELYAVINPDWIEADATSPDVAGDFDLAQLTEDLHALTS